MPPADLEDGPIPYAQSRAPARPDPPQFETS